MRVQVKDTRYVRDVKSKALLNTNLSELNEYKQKKLMMSKINEINNLKQEVEEIKTTMQKILSILSEQK
jgi:hypothetical protein